MPPQQAPSQQYAQPPQQGQQPQHGQQPQYGQQPPYAQQPPYGQQPQGPGPQGQPYYPGQAVPPAKTGGAGTILAIVLGALLLVGGGGAIAAYMLLGSSGSSLSDDVDQSAVLKTNAEALMAAVRSGDSQKVEEPLLNLAILPEHAQAWFTATFGPELGARLYADWQDDVFKKLPEMIVPFKEAIQSGHTVIKVVRVVSPGDPSEKFQQSLLKKMKKPTPLYSVEFRDSRDYYGNRIYYFAIVNGHFGFVGSMVGGW